MIRIAPQSATFKQHRIATSSSVKFGVEISSILNDPDADRFVNYTKNGLGPERIMDMLAKDQYAMDPSGNAIYISGPPKVEIPSFTWDKPSKYGVGGGSGGGTGNEHSPGIKQPYKLPISEVAKIVGLDSKIEHFLRERADSKLKQQKIQFDDISRNPPGRKNMPRTLKKAFTRSITQASVKGEVFDPAQHLGFERQDFRYDVERVIKQPKHKLLIVNIRDYSGSMGKAENDIVKKANFLETSYLKYLFGSMQANELGVKYSDDEFFKREDQEYDDYKQLYMLHDSQAELVSSQDFYMRDDGGGTNVASAYKHLKEILLKDYPPSEWNVFINHYSDGDVFGTDAKETAKLQKELMDMGVNLITYTEVGSRAGKANGLGKQLEVLNKDLPYYRSALVKTANTTDYIKMIKAHLAAQKVPLPN